VNPETGKAQMRFDECWYCLACETDCPKDAIVVKIPYLLR
jgi:NAD-dependent dihydropyrimidine dehydrogenase PreA subunit